MVADIMKEKPGDVVDFMIQWLNAKGKTVQRQSQKHVENKQDGLSSSSGNTGSETESEEEEKLVIPKKKAGPRQSVSAEAFGMWNKKADFTPKVVKKTPEQENRIKTRLSQSFMFAN